jgi:uncharacterized protein DUF1549/uncharacterized protein DUF1553
MPGLRSIAAALVASAAMAPLAAGEAPGFPADSAPGSPTDSAPGFRNDVQPILTKAGCNSGACHGAAAGKNGFKLSLRGYDLAADHSVLTRQAAARRVNRERPDESLLLRKPLGQVQHGGGQRFEEGSPEHQILREWIRAGAPGPGEHDVMIESIETAPAEASGPIGSKVELKVLARYSDGSSRDVTRWVKYGVTNEAVASVDERGFVAIIGSGESAVTAWFASKVAFARVISPFIDPLPPDVFAKSERRNFIDDLVLEKLEKLRIAPSPPSTDLEFLRRASLDAIGVLPSSKEVLRFAADADPRKRERLVESLLSRKEFTDYWATKWSDLLLLNSRKLPSESLAALHEFIRRSVEENKPWDRFVREIVTASGSTVQNGAAAYFLLHKDPIDLSETTSQAFLGMSITCARCHNHPLEKWTQDQYYGMANLFGRVKLKNGDRPGEALVLSASFGDILHPRTGKPMPPQPLDAKPIGLDDPGDRREVLAAWLTSPENPYFARAIVNRVWKNFFGRGLVDPEDDLRVVNPSSNEPLFQAVVKDLGEHGFDLKHLMRTIMLSAAYQRSSAPHLGNDHDGIYYSRYVIRRLPAEVVLDAYASVTEVPTPFPGYPAGFRALQLRDSQVASYFLKAFGRPDRNQTCACERTETSSLAQVLHVSNGDTLDDKLRAKDNVLGRLLERKTSDEEILDELYLAALTRFPTEKERAAALGIVAGARKDAGDAPGARREILEDLLWGILSGKEFLFNR